MKSPVYVVVCGQIRQTDVFAYTMAALEDWRRRGLIAGIIVSTWETEAERFSGLRSTSREQGWDLVLGRDPGYRIAGNYIQQTAQLYQGVQRTPAGAWILKTRCDNHHGSFDIERLLALDFQLDPADRALDIFGHRVWVPGFEITHPFFLRDQIFFAQRDDMAALCNFDISYEALDMPAIVLGDGNHSASAAPEIRRFLFPFLRRFPILQSYRETWSFAAYHCDCRGAVKAFNAGQDLYWDFVATYYSILQRFFRIGPETIANTLRFGKDQHYLYNGIWDTGEFLSPFAGQPELTAFQSDEDWLAQVMNGTHSDPAHKIFTAALARVRANGFASIDPPALCAYRDPLIRLCGDKVRLRSQGGG